MEAPDPWELIYRTAGIVGVDPDSLTLRELVWMAQGRADSLWDHTSEVLCLLANIHRDAKKRSKPFTTDQFRPRRAGDKTRKETPLPVGIDALRVFLPPKQRRKGKPCEPPPPASPSSS